jgi:hypothetical protein
VWENNFHQRSRKFPTLPWEKELRRGGARGLAGAMAPPKNRTYFLLNIYINKYIIKILTIYIYLLCDILIN